MSNEKRDLNTMPVVEVLNLIIDGKLKGDAVAGILRDATDATHFAYQVLDARLALIARAREMVIYGKDGKLGAGSTTTAVVGSERGFHAFGMPIRN